MFIDTHLHLSRNYGENPVKFVKNVVLNNVKVMIVSFCDKDSIIESGKLELNFPGVYYSFGFHPDVASIIENDDIDFLVKMINDNEKVVSIGEIGLDYYYKKENRLDQIKLFERQLKIAEEINLPVVIHSRDAACDTYDILSKYNISGVIHCFSGSLEMAMKYIKLGFYIGIGGVVTFKNSKLQDVVKNIPLTSIVLETDSPYLAPDPYRGTTNESKNIPIIAKKIAELKGVSVEEVMNITSKNAISLFDLHL